MVDAVLLLGPTACGKSALALQLATQLPIEIISIDSAQVYRGMDIGTAKPTAAELAAVPHHLIDIRDPAEVYSAADFVHDATTLVAQIKARGRLPLIVGGTMLYARALREGLSDLPAADAATRQRIEARAQALGWPALHAELTQIDPTCAARLAPNDSQRIQRALEVFELTGQPLSVLQQQTNRPALNLRCIALLPDNRALLHQRIEQRWNQMLEAGLLDEVRQLMQRGDLRADQTSQRSVGYRQAWEHLLGETSWAEFRLRGLHATRQLAKRQITWLRSMRDAQALDPFNSNIATHLRLSISQLT